MASLIGGKYDEYVLPGKITEKARTFNKFIAMLPPNSELKIIKFLRYEKEGKTTEFLESLHNELYGKEKDEIVIETSEEEQDR